eukprot:CAMPEP_0185770554 /NCGR_PEP_ID=MMETSP1174-20130828/59783_1 /TAXON_ID=35687 /ORGANISM="Dictyocha speculum, Strain CCMP1381" /LENGTH=71 /DNA_ID=CAMNT_0028456037 /DNA_START=316 /DNA_END=528 /DNA_ORIENTATION=+
MGQAEGIWERYGTSDWIAYGGKNPSSMAILQTFNDFFAIGAPEAKLVADREPSTLLTTTNDLNETTTGSFK